MLFPMELLGFRSRDGVVAAVREAAEHTVRQAEAARMRPRPSPLFPEKLCISVSAEAAELALPL